MNLYVKLELLRNHRAGCTYKFQNGDEEYSDAMNSKINGEPTVVASSMWCYHHWSGNASTWDLSDGGGDSGSDL